MFVHNSMSSEKVPFALSIDKFSLQVRRGYYESSDLPGGKWILVLLMNDGDGYEDFIEVQLKRKESNGRDQFVELKLSIVDCFGFKGFTEGGRYCYCGSSDTHKVLSVNRMSPLSKLRYLPNDTLTLRGEMVIYEETERPFETEKDFKKSLKNSSFAVATAVLCILWNTTKGVCSFVAANTTRYVVPSVAVAAQWFKSVLSNLRKKQKHNDDGGASHKELVPVTHGGRVQNTENFSGTDYYHNRPIKNGQYGENMMCVFVDESYFNSMQNGRYGRHKKWHPSNRELIQQF